MDITGNSAGFDSTRSLRDIAQANNLKDSLKKATDKTDTKEDVKKYNNELKEVAKNFEALLLKQILQESRGSDMDGGLFEKSVMRDFNNDLYDTKMSEHLAESGGMGLAEVIYQKYKK